MIFHIRALNAGGRVSLRLEAASAAEAAAQARGDGLTVLRVRPDRGLESLFARRARFPLLLFTRELLALLSSGLTLIEALQTLLEKETRGEPRQVLTGVLERLNQGETFSAALGHFPEVFPPLYAASVRAAERSGDLAPALARYVAWQERLDTVRRRVISASIYPLMLLVLGGLVALFLIGFVTPRFASIYADNLQRLPWASRLLLGLGVWIDAHGLGAALGFAGALLTFAWAASRPTARTAAARLAWRLPALGERLRVFQLTRFYRTVGMLLSGGTPILPALGLAAGLLTLELRARVAVAAGHIRAGQPISEAMQQAGLTTPVAGRLLRVGEKSGQMGEMMENIASFHDEETSRFVDSFTRVFEPLLMAVIGLLVGGIVVLLYLPIFELAGSIE
ncbi:MAG: type II secretion system protein [Hydrogenophilales bacterium CG17_big_fil_post_rev_8_21_14_2_50_63_12]|nr:MAG: type II secretion system protein [Hydrogenophilales bacterium CG17_big_fil_post_rev_8_21_14_2_50_63_12]PIX97569.1 MAG: type II secretion system protein [Hydrogenophilales bacterium CG_4_10_14_3_um_filter_63_21]PJB02752.1 MAG: type II secretion system protein [Hydrogenophilales bacterium CG_4_9_14_3_um_filter_63_34]